MSSHLMPDWVGCRKIASSVLRCLLLMASIISQSDINSREYRTSGHGDRI